MKNTRIVKVILGLSGLVAVIFGGSILIDPVTFYATSDIKLGDNISLLNEMRAAGGGLLASGLVVMLGAFVTQMAFTSLVLSSLLYLCYGSTRLVSMLADGQPVESLIQAAVIEGAIGLVCVIALIKYRKTE